MKRSLVLAIALAAALPFVPSAGLAQRTKGVVKATPEDYAQLQNVKELVGYLGAADEGALSVRVDISRMEPNPAFKPPKLPAGAGGQTLVRLQQQIARRQAEMARARTPQQRQRAMINLQREMQRLQQEMARAGAKAAATVAKASSVSPFKIVTENREFELLISDKVIVRWANPPFEYDEKGDVKKYSKEELAKLRGSDAKLPGYAGKLEDLSPGQAVKLFLKPLPKTTKKNLLEEPEGDFPRPTVAMIVILQEEGGLPVPVPKTGKK